MTANRANCFRLSPRCAAAVCMTKASHSAALAHESYASPPILHALLASQRLGGSDSRGTRGRQRRMAATNAPRARAPERGGWPAGRERSRTAAIGAARRRRRPRQVRRRRPVTPVPRCAAIRRTMSPSAPSAIRTPISRRRRTTVPFSTPPSPGPAMNSATVAKNVESAASSRSRTICCSTNALNRSTARAHAARGETLAKRPAKRRGQQAALPAARTISIRAARLEGREIPSSAGPIRARSVRRRARGPTIVTGVSERSFAAHASGRGDRPDSAVEEAARKRFVDNRDDRSPVAKSRPSSIAIRNASNAGPTSIRWTVLTRSTTPGARMSPRQRLPLSGAHPAIAADSTPATWRTCLTAASRHDRLLTSASTLSRSTPSSENPSGRARQSIERLVPKSAALRAETSRTPPAARSGSTCRRRAHAPIPSPSAHPQVSRRTRSAGTRPNSTVTTSVSMMPKPSARQPHRISRTGRSGSASAWR